jgi:tetratricopeptide (TPR) repeat protein
MKTIGLGVIVKGTAQEAKKLETLLASIAQGVDKVFVTITGGDDPKPVKEVAKKHNAHISYFDWIDDFAAARTYNLSQIDTDWYLWLDADDTLQNPERLRDLVEQPKVDGYWFWYEYNRDKHGNVTDAHWKAQLTKNDGHFEWRGAIHEDPQQLRPANWVKTTACTRVHHTNDEATKESYERNLRILLKERAKNPEEPRTMFYLGRTYMATGQLDEAVEVLNEYLTRSGWDEERYEATMLIGLAYFQTGNYDAALRAYNDAILEREDYPDAYIQKGSCYLKQESWEKAVVCFETAINRKLPSGSTYFNPMLYRRDVFIGISVAYLNLGKLEKAYAAVSKALEADPKSEEALELKSIIVHTKNNADTVRKYTDIAKFMEARGQRGKILQLLHSVPKELADNPIILAMKGEHSEPRIWPDKSIAIYCGSTAEDWTPEAVNGKGIGGSETAVVELGKRLAQKGWKVTVFNQCSAPPEGLDFDGVHYQNYWTFNASDSFDVLWAWRLPELFDLDLAARIKILDLHDVMSPADFPPERLAKIDKIFVKSKYHRSLYPKVSDEKFVIVGNGIDLARFEGEAEKGPYRFVYSSTPNRGLDILLEFMWPKIKAQIPEAELHVYYGWETFMKIERRNPERMRWARKVQDLMKQPGVVDHGRVGQQELAQDLLKTSFWLYPTYFPEIHCITACEMQAAGVIPITSGYAALAETQKSGLKVEGDVFDPEWQERYVRLATGLVGDVEGTVAARNQAWDVSKEFSWDLVADEWDRELA